MNDHSIPLEVATRPESGQARLVGRQDRASGQGLVEFALLVPVFLLLIIALFDIGMYVVAMNDIGNAARSGARVAIVDQTSGAAATAAVRQATALGLNATDNVTVRYWLPDTSFPPSATPPPGQRCTTVRINCLAEVTVSYEWQPITKSIVGLIFPDAMSLRTTTRMPIERVYP